MFSKNSIAESYIYNIEGYWLNILILNGGMWERQGKTGLKKDQTPEGWILNTKAPYVAYDGL